MAEWATASTPREADDEEPLLRHLNLPWLVVAALLIGAGLFCATSWLITFQWAYFPGLALLAFGFLMLFNRRAGLDRAE